MQIRHPIKSKSMVKRLSNMFMESRFTILYLYQKAVKNAKAKKGNVAKRNFFKSKRKA